MNDKSCVDAIPAPLIFIFSAVSNYSGTAIAAALLFSIMPAATVAWYRGLVTAVFLLAWRRPFSKGLTWRDIGLSTLFGLATLGMNIIFYEGVVRIPLGTTVSLEFLGPITVAVIAGRGIRTRLATVLALVGVVSIGGLGLDLSDRTQLIGALAAIVAGVLWAGYVVMGQKIATQRSGIDNLAIGMTTATIILSPVAWRNMSIAVTSGWRVAAIVVVVGVLTSMIPYSVEQINMKRLGKDTFALMLALFPATSTVVAAIILGQIPNPGEMVGLVCITAAVVLVNYNATGSPSSKGAS